MTGCSSGTSHGSQPGLSLCGQHSSLPGPGPDAAPYWAGIGTAPEPGSNPLPTQPVPVGSYSPGSGSYSEVYVRLAPTCSQGAEVAFTPSGTIDMLDAVKASNGGIVTAELSAIRSGPVSMTVMFLGQKQTIQLLASASK